MSFERQGGALLLHGRGEGRKCAAFLHGSQASANELDRQSTIFGISRIVAAQKFV